MNHFTSALNFRGFNLRGLFEGRQPVFVGFLISGLAWGFNEFFPGVFEWVAPIAISALSGKYAWQEVSPLRNLEG